MHSEIVLMLLFAHKDAAAYPPSTELQLDLFHQPTWWDLLCSFVQPPTHSAPWCPQSAAHARRAASRSGLWVLSSSVEEFKAASWVDPDSALSSTTLSAEQSARAPTCLALPCCFLQACKYANVCTALAPLGKAAYLLPCVLRISSGAR